MGIKKIVSVLNSTFGFKPMCYKNTNLETASKIALSILRELRGKN